LPTISKNQTEIILDESATRYLVKVLRLGEGAAFAGFDSQSCQFDLKLKKVEGSRAIASIEFKRDQPNLRDSLFIALGQSLPKAGKMDLILRQGTEAGVHRFIPMVTQRSISRPDPSQLDHKNDRWSKILVEACRQCGRNDLPQLGSILDWPKVLASFTEYDQVLLPYEKEAPTLRTVLESKPSARKLLVLVGPEGGWTREEVGEAETVGAEPVHLPTPILRTETAGVAVVSMIQFFYSALPGGHP